MKRKINLFLLLLVFFPCMIFMSACGTQSVKFNIKFMVDNEVYSTVETGGKETIAMPEDPIKEGYNFDGWYWDENIWSRPFTANSLLNAPLSSDMKVYAKFTYIHTHNLTKVDKKEPTCTENGYEEYYTCECGKMFSDENGTTEISKINILSAIGHTFSEWYELKPASYTEKGMERRDCSICGYYEIRDIEKLVVEIVDPTELNVEYGILKWDGTSPYGFDVIVNGESQKVLGNSLETQLKSDDYNSVCVACIYENGTKGNYIELNNFVVNAPISNLHFTDNGTNVTFTWDSASELYDYTFVVNNQETTVSKDIKTYSISRNSVAAGTEISVYVNGVDSANFKPSKKATIKLEQLDHPNLSINKLDVEWENVENSEYYLVKGLTNITTTDTKYSYDGANSGDYTITVEVYGDDYLYNSSTLTFKKLIKPDISIENKIVSWNAIAGQVRYATLFNNNETKFSANSFKLEEINTEYEIFLYASPVQSNSMQSDVIVIKQFVYEDYSNIYWGNVFNNKISYNKVMPSNILYVPECCQNVDFSSINNQNIILISNKRPDKLSRDLISNVIIPNNVIEIEESAFTYCKNIISIIISNDITSIGASAFSNCSKLTSIFIPNSVSSIGYSAFSNCSNLALITLPNSITTIGSKAFEQCSELVSINIPSSVTSVGNDAFGSNFAHLEYYKGCYKLKEVHISNLEAWFNISFESATSNPLYYAHHLYLDDVELTEIIVPNEITQIKDYTLYGASSITSIIMSENVLNIGDSAFYGCESLQSVTIKGDVLRIGANSFYNCYNLISISIFKVKNIGNNAFFNCKKLNKVSISNLKSWFEINFYSEYSNHHSSNPLYYGHHLYVDDKEVTEIDIPSSVIQINERVLVGASSITSITIPESVETIGNYAFGWCTGLTSLKFKNNSQLTSIGDYAFFNCSELKSITIPNSVTSMGSCLFLNCSGLVSVELSNAVRNVKYATFSGCSSLISIGLSDNITNIGACAFYECSSLISIIISTSITKINSNSFYNCSNLTIYCKATSIPSDWDSDWNPSNCPVYCYSETQPSKSGNYWHYVDGEVTKW